MKFAYFNPTVMAVDDVTAEQYSKLREIVNTAHEHGEHNDEGNPNISIRGGQQIQIVPNEFKLDTTFLSQYIEERCQDGKALHQIWHMDVSGKVQELNLKGHGNKYFKNPELIPSGIYKSEKGYLCSQRQLTKKEREAYDNKFQ